MRVALVYDWINTFGGAERVLLELYRIFPQAILFTSVYDRENTPWAKVFQIKTSFLQKIPFASSHHEFLPLLTPFAFENFVFDDFDLVISVTSTCAKGIITKPQTLHVCYLLTPTRYLWSHRDFYFRNRFFKFVSFPAISYLRRWDLVAAARPDYLIAISKTVQMRVKQFYNRDCVVIYPPVAIEKFRNTKKQRGDYFLVVSRLVPYKRIDLVIRVFNKLQLPLIIVGSGRQEFFLKSIAGSTIKFVKDLTDEELIRYYEGCRALILPSEEDFGIVSVEAQAAGKPVIAYNKGGAQETIKENITGIFFNEQTVNALIKAIEYFEKINFSEKECRDNSKRFSRDFFRKKFFRQIKQFLSNKIR